MTVTSAGSQLSPVRRARAAGLELRDIHAGKPAARKDEERPGAQAVDMAMIQWHLSYNRKAL